MRTELHLRKVGDGLSNGDAAELTDEEIEGVLGLVRFLRRLSRARNREACRPVLQITTPPAPIRPGAP